MKVQIDDTVYEGTALEIVETLWHENDDRNEFPDVERYMERLRKNCIRSTGQDCSLPHTGLEDCARVDTYTLAQNR